jgi:hypothetical protein
VTGVGEEMIRGKELEDERQLERYSAVHSDSSCDSEDATS